MDNETPERDSAAAEGQEPTIETAAAGGASGAEASAAADATATDSGPLLTFAGAASDSAEATAPKVLRGRIDKFGTASGTGRRKTSVARVRISDGNGQLTINGRALEDYFRTVRDREAVESPLRATGTLGTVDIWVRVEGGGTTGQAGAIVLGVARALQVRNPALHAQLSEGGYLTRDSRMVERKKYGYKKARRSFQFSKR
jgi:small subunit ribosomal protein S9